MTNGARPRRGLHCLLPVLAASAAVAAAALPATAATGSAALGSASGSATAQSRTAAPWWLAALHLPAALRAVRAAGSGVTVAVLSTGVDASHPDLAGTVTAGPDFSKTGRKQGQEYWGDEGTAVASLIAGHGHGTGAKGATGDEGITGVAPGVRILSVQVTLEYDDPLNADPAAGRRLPDAIAAGIRYAVGHGATVIALPLDPGTLGPSDTGDPAAAGGSAAERSAVSFALARNVVLVAPAGDNGAGTNAADYPAAYRGVIAVGASARDGRLAPFTGVHSYVALTAPGAGVIPAVPVPGGMETDPAAGLMAAAPDGGYQSLASTDMSAALIAGVAALIRSSYPRLTVPAVTSALEHGATTPAGQAAGEGWGHGELNATAALKAAAALAAALPAPAPSPSPSAAPSRTASARPARSPAVTNQAATPVAASDPGHLVRSLLVGLVVAAGVLIACLIGAITLTRARRRRARRAAPFGAGPASRAGPSRAGAGTRGARGARHARGQSPAAAPGSPVRFAAPASPATPAGFSTSASPATPTGFANPGFTNPTGFDNPASFTNPADFTNPASLTNPAGFTNSIGFTNPADPDPPAGLTSPSGFTKSIGFTNPADPDPPAGFATPASPSGPPAAAGTSAPAPLTGVIWPSGPTQRQRPDEEPPWPPAPPPASKLSPESFLPAEPEADPDTALAPWEKAPADFTTAQSPEDRAPWPVTNTGPIYVWNPAATTGPLNVVEGEEDPAD